MEKEELSTIVTEQELIDGCSDAFSVVYSKDGKRLLKCNNSQLKEYVVKEGTEVICREAFYRCVALTMVSLPHGLISIGINAFNYCVNLADITLPEGLVSIWSYSFDGCERLTELELPASLRKMGDNPFHDIDNLQLTCKSPYFKIENDLLIQGKTAIGAIGMHESIIFPDYITKVIYSNYVHVRLYEKDY